MDTSTGGLASGVVTFVFTDIEGSTRLRYQLEDGYVAVLERHRELLRAVWADHRGREVSVEGDSFFVAFADARDAVAACSSAQRALAAEDWPAGVEVRVRIGLQTGLASPHGDDYVALAVHQAARVMASGHGGQVLMTEDSVAALGDDHEFDLRPLGRFGFGTSLSPFGSINSTSANWKRTFRRSGPSRRTRTTVSRARPRWSAETPSDAAGGGAAAVHEGHRPVDPLLVGQQRKVPPVRRVETHQPYAAVARRDRPRFLAIFWG